MSKYGVFSDPYFPAFSQNAGKDRPKKTPFLDTFHAVYILLLRYSGNRNLNLSLHNKYLLGALVFKIFKIVKIVFFPCFYVRDNRVICSSHPPGKILSPLEFLLTKILSPVPLPPKIYPYWNE